MTRDIERSPGNSRSFIELSIFTLWLFVLSVGLFGLVTSYARPEANALSDELHRASMIDIELMPDSYAPVMAQESVAEIPNTLEQPPPVSVLESQELIEPVDTAILKVVSKGKPTKHDTASAASIPQKAEVAQGGTVDGTGITTLTYGQGYGKQPAPIYPYTAIRGRQAGEVTIFFIVKEDGRVAGVKVEKSSSWPLLDESALSTVRNRWRFPPGAVGRYRIPFVFKLKQ